MTKKSFFAKVLRLIISNSGTKKIKKISAQKAISLQKDYIKNLSKTKIDICTPPYVEISKHLTNDKTEIFKAAVYYLNAIAENEPRYKTPIISILRHYKEKNKRPQDDIDYLDFYLQQLEK